MEEIKIDSYAKVNLSLDIVNKREDGYHNIETIMQEIDLKDDIYIKTRDRGLVIRSNSRELPLDERNLVYKAYASLKKLSGIDKGAEIYIDKKIPLGGGLAGGSSNCAASLIGLNELWDLGYSMEELSRLGSSLGADVPFFFLGGTAYGEGIGDRLSPLRSLGGNYILLANSGIHISTKEVYEGLGFTEEPRKTRIREKLAYIEDGDLETLARSMENVMEDMVFLKYPELKSIKETMEDYGSLGSLMTGSGATVFGLFDDYGKMLECRDRLSEKIDFVYVGRTR